MLAQLFLCRLDIKFRNGPRVTAIGDQQCSVTKDIYHDIINIFPNPGSGLYKIDFPNSRKLPTGFKLYDSRGIKYPISHFLRTKDHILLDISKLNKGLYFISLNMGGKKVIRKLFYQ